MYSYNSTHKIIVALLGIAWAIWTFSSRSETQYYDNGQIIRSGQTIDNKKEGNWTWYHPNGKPNIKGFFENGKREGIWQTFDSTGVLIQEKEFKKDLLNGEIRVYNKEGEVIKSILYKNNEMVE